MGARQISCSKAECRQRRKREAQSRWLNGNREYFVERRLRKRSEAAAAADEAANRPCQFRSMDPAKGPVPRRPAAIRMGAPLDRVPWELAQDEIGVQVTDLIGLVAKVLLRATQDEIRVQLAVSKADRPRVPFPPAQDEIEGTAS